MRVIVCQEEKKQEVDLKYLIYPSFFVVSAFFLLLTLIAFFLSPEFDNLHGRSMACQAGSLLIMYLGMTLIYIMGTTIQLSLCITTGRETSI
jgi:hypothetical protein